MRIGVYLGRHAGAGGGIGVYARGLIRSLLGLLEQAEHLNHEIVFYGDAVTLNSELLEFLEMSSILFAAPNIRGNTKAMPGGGFRSAGRFFRSLPNGGKVRVLLRELPSVGIRKGNMLLDQITVPAFAIWDRIDFLHSLANIGCVFSRRPQMVTVHDLYQGWGVPMRNEQAQVPRGLNARFYRSIFKAQFVKARYVLTDAQHVATEIQERYRLPQSRLKVIPLGLDGDFLAPVRERSPEQLLQRWSQWKSTLSLSDGSLLLFASSDPRKNLRRTLEMFSSLRPSEKLIPVLVKVLDAPAGREIEQFLRSEKLSWTLLPWGSREELLFTYLSSRVLCLPSLAEGFGFPALEALACGCAVVSGPIEYLQNTENAGFRSCDPTSVESIRGAFRHLWEDRPARSPSPEERLRALKSAVESRARGVYRTLDETSRETFEVYRRLAFELGKR